jgi:hypothetical protein
MYKVIKEAIGEVLLERILKRAIDKYLGTKIVFGGRDKLKAFVVTEIYWNEHWMPHKVLNFEITPCKLRTKARKTFVPEDLRHEMELLDCQVFYNRTDY